MVAEQLTAGIESTRYVLSNIGADQLDARTPCASWDVRAVINHVVAAGTFAAETVELGTGSPPQENQQDYAAGDFVGFYDAMAERCLSAFCAPGSLDKMLTLPFAELPGAAFLGIVAVDQFTHGWDLARATGQNTDLDPELAGQLLEQAQASLPKEYRGPDGQAPFGPEQAAPTDAAPADRLAAFLGRSV